MTLLVHVCVCKHIMCIYSENSSCKNQDPELDSAGNHGLVCHPGVKAMRATLLEKALEKSFRLADGNPVKQPSTSSVFTKQDLSCLFPGHLNHAEAEKRKKLALEFLEIKKKHPRGPVRTAELGMLPERFPAPSVQQWDDSV